jgi:hypothetical protein
MYYVAAPSYKRAHIARKHYILNAGNGNWSPTRMLLELQP